MADDDLKSAVLRARKQPMQFAAVLGKSPADHRLSLHATRSGRSLAKALREETGLKLVTWGVTEPDPARSDTLVLVVEDKVLPGLAKKLSDWLKLQGAAVRRVALKVDGQELGDEDGDGDAVTVDAAAAVAVEAPAAVAAVETHAPPHDAARATSLKAALKQLIPKVQALLADATPGAADLPGQAKACHAAIEQGDLDGAAAQIKALATRVLALQPQQKPQQASPERAQQAIRETAKAQERAAQDAQFEQATASLDAPLAHAVRRMRALQNDPARQEARAAMARIGTQAQDCVRQLRAAKRRGDARLVASLTEQLEGQRTEARKALQQVLPSKEALAQGRMKPEEAWVELVALLDLSSPKDGAVFWSGGKDNAIDEGTARHGVSLESTPGGVLIDGWLADMPWDASQGDGPPFKKDLWALASATYALQAEGTVVPVQTPEKAAAGGGDMWKRVEYRILRRKELQGLVTIAPPIIKAKAPGDD